MKKVILILCDGLRYDTAAANMGYLGHLVERKMAVLFRVRGELPSLSRPMYETIFTGLPAAEHGITSNTTERASIHPNIFQLARDAGLVTAASAYSWFSELYNHAPFDRINDREVDNPLLAIQHGRFYTEDDTPDAEVFAAGAMLIRRNLPDLLLIHLMGMDFIGEKFGANSREYRNHALYQDSLLAVSIPEWRSMGYTLLVTSDHGMSNDGSHGGTTEDVREIPLFLISDINQIEEKKEETISQLQIAPTLLKLLELPSLLTSASSSII